MQLPFAGLLGLASGAMGFVQKVFSHQGAGADFDAELTAAMTGGLDTCKSPLSRILSGKAALDEETFRELLATPEGMLLFQFMAALRETGLTSSDIHLLLNGSGNLMSDEGLGTILAHQGFGEEDIAKLMANPEMKAQIKAGLASSFTAALDGRAAGDGTDMNALRALAASDAATVDSVIDRIVSGKQLPSGREAISEKTDSAGEQLAAVRIGALQRNVSYIAGEIKTLIAEALKKIDLPARPATSAANTAKVEKMIRTAGDTFGLSSDVMRDLFFASDEPARKQAVDRATSQVSAYLRSQEGRKLGADAADALALLRSAMTEQEFSGIDTALKLWQPGQTLPDVRIALGRETYEALAGSLGGREPGILYEQHMKGVMDQLRQALPPQMKNSEGHVTLRLHPPMLGRVDVSMTIQDGQLKAVFKADQLVTRDILVQNMHLLKDALAEQGIRATQFSVSSTVDHGPSHEGYAFAHQERHRQEPSYSARSSGNQDGFAGKAGEYANSSAAAQLSEAGGLDLFA